MFNENGKLINSNDPIWTILSAELDGKIAPKSIYINILLNRNGWQTKLREIYDIKIYENNDHNNVEVSDNDSSSSSSSSLNTDSKRKLFKVKIPYDLYRTILPEKNVYKDGKKFRTYEVLKPFMWTDVVNDAFINAHRLPCNFIYKRGKVFRSSKCSKHFVTFQAHCKDCGAKLSGWSDHEPEEGEPLIIIISTNDTRGEEQKHTTKRPLKGNKRLSVGSDMVKDLASNWRRNNVIDVEYVRISPPNLYNLQTLRKAKQEYRDKKLGIKYKCPIESLVEFKHNSKHSGSIHSIGIDPFFAHYWTNHQISIYKDLSNDYIKLSIDATGSLIKKQKRTSLELLTANIFLYEGIISTNYGNIPVTQMISEKHDTLTIFNWLASWMAARLRPPNEVICDNSRALLAAISRAFFKGGNINSYINHVFDLLTERKKEIPETYIRLDVAHMINIFCRIKCLSGITNKNLKEFYVRGFRLLLTSEDLDSFKKILENLMTIMLSETDGWTNDNAPTPSEIAREYILNLIKGINTIDSSTNTIFTNFDDNDVDSSDIADNDDDDADNKDNDSAISVFLGNIKKESLKNSLIQGNRISAYYLPELVQHTLRLCKHFPLWSNVLRSIFQSPFQRASSAAVENDFKELKTQILKFDVCPMTADRFVITHLESIDSNVKLFKSKQLRNNTVIEQSKLYLQNEETNEIENKSDDQQEESDEKGSEAGESDNSINAIENWKGKGKESQENTLIQNYNDLKKVHRKTKYMSPTKEIDKLLSTRKTRSTNSNLLINGNKATPIILSKKRFLVQNTCPFDAVAVLIAIAYTDIPTYQKYIDENINNDFLQFCKNLATTGPTHSIYKNRVSLLQNIFKVDTGVTDIRLIDATCNVNFIVTSYLKNVPSATESIMCSKCSTSKVFYNPTIILN